MPAGPQAPHRPDDPVAVLDLFGAGPDDLPRWRSAGLPLDADGRADPFAVCNWLSWGHLDLAPALERRWRAWLAFFRPFRDGRERPRRLVWKRHHRLALPAGVARVRWRIPGPIAHPGQTLGPSLVEDAAWDGSGWIVERSIEASAPADLVVRGSAEVESTPRPASAPAPAPQRRRWAGHLAALAAGFTYIYRTHRCDEDARVAARRLADHGTCLDAALLLADRIEADGQAWRLVGGVVASDDLANPHYWLEVEAGGAWHPLDPTPACIARMLGEDVQPWAEAWAGGLDARRVILAIGPGRDGWISAVPGAATAWLADGSAADAWPCQDWVCGECRAAFVPKSGTGVTD